VLLDERSREGDCRWCREVSVFRLALVGAFIAATAGPSAAADRRLTMVPAPTVPVRQVLDKYCVTCHSDRLRTASLSLEKLDVAEVPAHADIWEKVALKLRAGAMPPPRSPRPDEATSKAIAAWLEATLDAAAEAAPDPGARVAHRLNRTEYTNAIRDLLALDVDGRALLPADDQGFGFDNNADTLRLSPGLMDRYLLAARRIGRLAVGDSTVRPVVESYNAPRLLIQDERMSEDLPFGSRGGFSIRHQFPVDAEYVLRVRLPGPTLRAGDEVELRIDGERVEVFKGGPRPQAPAGEGAPAQLFEVRFSAKAGPRTVGITLPRRTAATEGLLPTRLPVGSISFRSAGVAGVDIEGPFNTQGLGDTPSRQRIFVCRPRDARGERRCATEILSTLARHAYRRPVREQDLQVLLPFYERGRQDSFDVGIRTALERILVDPEFLFRIERAPSGVTPGSAYRISDLELASRLSFFLWSSIPDDTLLDLAVRGQLKNTGVLESQVRRMLADSRSSALVTNFASQWLHLRNMRGVTPDAVTFPEFDDNLREAFQRETELFIESQIREDRPVVDLLTANYTFLNERLARHYGIPQVYGSHFRRVDLSSPVRTGLLGHGSILTVTSYATRTSPVVRGKWLLENILGAPPPPPPPDVPALPENGETEKALSVRERMEQHRKNPVCASCHSRMDPLGFALENFDAIGKWREVGEDKTSIDASGVLPDGAKFDGPVELRGLLLGRRGDFVRTVADKMLTYAVGRGLDHGDRPIVRRIVREAEPSGSTWSSLVLGIVRSTPFQMRRSPS
jgi:hypothetical protein